MKCEKCGESFKIVGKISSCPWCGKAALEGETPELMRAPEVKKTDPVADNGDAMAYMDKPWLVRLSSPGFDDSFFGVNRSVDPDNGDAMTPAGRLQSVGELIASDLITMEEGKELLSFPEVKKTDPVADNGDDSALAINALDYALKTLYSPEEVVARMAYMDNPRLARITKREKFGGKMNPWLAGADDSFFDVNRSVDPVRLTGYRPNPIITPFIACKHEFIPLFNSVSCKFCGLDRDEIKV
jgi:hypothetical protein